MVIDEVQVAADSFNESFRSHIAEADVALSFMRCIGSYYLPRNYHWDWAVDRHMQVRARSSLSAKRTGQKSETFSDVAIPISTFLRALMFAAILFSDNDVSDQR